MASGSSEGPGGPGTPGDASQDTTESYLGLPADSAEQLARDRGWHTVRRLAPDAIITMEYQEGRLNLAVRDDEVVRCWQG